MDSKNRHLDYAEDGTIHERVTQPRRPRTLCKDPGCGHPRSEHSSVFKAELQDYQYGRCTVFECPCQNFVEESAAEDSLDSTSSTGVGSHVEELRCEFCGTRGLMHVALGEECLRTCERNWRDLEALRSSRQDVDVLKNGG